MIRNDLKLAKFKSKKRENKFGGFSIISDLAKDEEQRLCGDNRRFIVLLGFVY